MGNKLERKASYPFLWKDGIENPASILKNFKGKSAKEDAKKFALSKIREKTNKGYIEK